MKVVLGVCGGIAAYKSCVLLRLLQQAGHEVKVVMTESAQQFVHPNTFAALSRSPVYDDLFAHENGLITHIELAKWSDLILIAPATATTIADLACGRASHLLTSVCLATESPCVIAPAMNKVMWSHPMTQENIKRLRHIDYRILPPNSGLQACGDVGAGRMMEPQAIVDALFVGVQDMHGMRVVVTAGPTHEPLDPIRFIGNGSSGKMGFAMARACLQRGAQVDLIVGPTLLSAPEGCQIYRVQTAADMLHKTLGVIESADILIGAAAVADYTPVQCSAHKIKKNEQRMQLSLQRTQDIIATVASRFPSVFTMGFCAETQDVISSAQQKRNKKGLDVIVVNQIDSSGYPINHDENTLSYLSDKQQHSFARSPKQVLAHALVDRMLQERQSSLKVAAGLIEDRV